MYHNNVIGPIDGATWYCMRQCREAVAHLKTLNDPVYDIEIRGEQAMLQHFMKPFIQKAA